MFYEKSLQQIVFLTFATGKTILNINKTHISVFMFSFDYSYWRAHRHDVKASKPMSNSLTADTILHDQSHVAF